MKAFPHQHDAGNISEAEQISAYFSILKFAHEAISNSDLRFGAFMHIPVQEVVVAGQPYTFVNFDNPMTALELSGGVNEAAFTSVWRVWMHTRYVGSPIPITFTVRRDSS